MRIPAPIIITLNLLVIVGLGICYLELVKFLLTEISFSLASEQPWPFYLKMMTTGGSALISCIAVFLFNRFITRQNMLHLGISCSIISFSFFIVIRGWPNFIPLIVSVLMTPYSLFAMSSFIGLPLLFAYVLRNQPMHGFSLVFRNGKDT